MSEYLSRKLKTDVPVHAWLTDPLAPEVREAITRLARAPDVQRIAVMPDVHLGEGSCVGVVLATQSLVYPQAVGADIGCGVSALPLHADAPALTDISRREHALAAIAAAVPILRHRSIASAPACEELSPSDLSDTRLSGVADRDGRIEFATLGRGNHFLEIQVDQDNRLWLATHSGSRVMGQVITRHHMAQARRVAGGLSCLDTNTDAGKAYLNDADWAARYARASRELQLRAVAEALSRRLGIPSPAEPVWGTDHNHARFEHHGGQRLLIHRKGASPASADLPAIIPGSMATPTFHAIGRGEPDSMCSSSHGAGRVLSRTAARHAISLRAFSEQTSGVTIARHAADRLVDEAPAAYRDVRQVMRAQRDLLRITRTLTPIVCLKGI